MYMYDLLVQTSHDLTIFSLLRRDRMQLVMVLLLAALVCAVSSMALFKRNLELLDMMKTPLLMTYRAQVPENQLYYLTQIHNTPQTSSYFRNDGVVPAL
ncbi:hypothetical protein GCK32_001027 [Trichostrongylus colubriformis]|uniref:Uncharacterized protein n=1 Tax=Trichostrongylus colubriformis TaxID=6319 RepID=A0AAN8IHG5_TRICO